MTRPRIVVLSIAGGLAIAGMVLLVAPARLAAGQAALPAAASFAPQVEELMMRFMADANVVGVTVGVERGTDVLIRGGWGFADRAARRPATADTSYRMGSSSKQFTASLVMRLVERNLVALEHSFASAVDWTGRFTFVLEGDSAMMLRVEQGGATSEGMRKK
jgi:CubicO group peptidase (beta-lactamase class C family)